MFFLHSDDLDAQVRAWRDVSPPDGLGERIVARIPARENGFLHGTRPIVCRLRWRPVAAFGMAVILLATVLLWPGSPGHPQVALADVERAVGQVNTVTATTAMTSHYLDNGTPVYTEVSRVWMRRQHPAVASLPAPELSWPQNLARLNMSSQSLQDERGEFVHLIAGSAVSASTDYMIDTGARLTPAKMPGMLNAILRPGHGLPDGAALITPARTEPARLAGRDVLRIVRQTSYRNAPEDTLCTETYFVDPATLRPVRVEVRAVTARTHKPDYTEITTDFRYDAIPPAGVFDWSPPKGSRVEVIYRTPAGLYKTSKIFPVWKGGAAVPPMPAKR